MRQDHLGRLNLTNFQRYLLRLGLNFVKTPSNEGTMYASPKNIAFMLSKHIPKKKGRYFREAERQEEVCFGPSFFEDHGGRSCGDPRYMENILSFSFLEFVSSLDRNVPTGGGDQPS